MTTLLAGNQTSPSDRTVISAGAIDARGAARFSGRLRAGMIGVDVGSRFLKLAQVDAVGGPLRLRAAATIDLRADDNGISDRKLDLAAVIRETLRSRCFRGKTLACLLPGSSYHEEPVELHARTSGATQTDIQRVLESRNPLAASANSLGFWKIPSGSEDKPSGPDRYRVVTVAEDKLTEFIDDLHAAGLIVRCIDGPSMTALRLVELENPRNMDRNVAVLDWGYSTTTLTFVSQGVPVFTRTLRDCNYNRVVEETAETLDVKQSSAQVLLQRFGFPQEFPGAEEAAIAQTIFDGTQSSRRTLAHELDRTIAYLQRKNALALPDRMLVIGAGSALRNLPGWLSRVTKFATERWSMAGLESEVRLPCPPPIFARAIALSAMFLEPFRS